MIKAQRRVRLKQIKKIKLKQIWKKFEQISLKLFDTLPTHSDVVFSTDMQRENSVKSNERHRRGVGQRLLKGPQTKGHLNGSNDDNKKQLIQIIHQTWKKNSMASKLRGRKVVMVCEEEAYLLGSANN